MKAGERSTAARYKFIPTGQLARILKGIFHLPLEFSRTALGLDEQKLVTSLEDKFTERVSAKTFSELYETWRSERKEEVYILCLPSFVPGWRDSEPARYNRQYGYYLSTFHYFPFELLTLGGVL